MAPIPPLTIVHSNIPQIPISTLRAVNNLVGRLTGSYRHAPGPEVSQKSVAAGTALPTGRAASPPYAPNADPHPDLQRRQMREEMA